MKLWLFAAFLILWGILLHPLIGSTAVLPGGSWQFVAAGAALVVLSLAAARLLGLDRTALGLRRAGAVRAAVVGALAGGATSAVAVAAMRYLAPFVTGQPVVYEPLTRVAAGDLVPHILVFLPLGTVIPEELAFRGTLLGGFLGRYSVRAALTAGAIAFALWHSTVAWFTVVNTTIPVVLVLPAFASALVVLFGGGLLLGGLRVLTGSVAASVAAHWAFNAIILIGLRYSRID